MDGLISLIKNNYKSTRKRQKNQTGYWAKEMIVHGNINGSYRRHIQKGTWPGS